MYIEWPKIHLRHYRFDFIFHCAVKFFFEICNRKFKLTSSEVFRAQSNIYERACFHTKKLHHRCFTRFWTCLWPQFLMDVANISGGAIFRCILWWISLFKINNQSHWEKTKKNKSCWNITEIFGTLYFNPLSAESVNVPFPILFMTANL